MATPITGTVNYTASISGIDVNARLGNGCVDATETYAYYPDTATRRIFRLDIASGSITALYGNTFQLAGFPIIALAFMPDGVTLIGSTDQIAGTAYFYTFLADGSSVSPTQVGTTTTMGLRRLRLDPSTGFLFVCHNSQLLLYTVPGTWSALANYSAFFQRVVTDMNNSRYDSDKFLVCATTSNTQYYICEYSKRSGLVKVLAGDGSQSAASTGSAYATPVGTASHVDSDSDGRVYYGTSPSVYSLIDGTVAQVLASGYGTGGGIIFLPISNRLLVCNGVYEVRKVQ